MLTAVLLEDHAWNEVAEPRRQEWRLAIRDLLEAHVFRTEKSPIILRLFSTPDDVRFAFEVPGEGMVAEPTLSRKELDPIVATYAEVCREIGALTPETRGRLVELDRRRKEAHDEGGAMLQKVLDAVGPTHDTARKIFTLLVALTVDTSALPALKMPHGADVSRQ